MKRLQLHAEKMGDTRRMKELAKKYLKPDSALRKLILSEPDLVPKEEILTKFKVYMQLLTIEFGK